MMAEQMYDRKWINDLYTHTDDSAFQISFQNTLLSPPNFAPAPLPHTQTAMRLRNNTFLSCFTWPEKNSPIPSKSMLLILALMEERHSNHVL